MKLRSRYMADDPFDGLTAEDIRKIRGGAAVSVTPGLEGLAPKPDPQPIRSTDPLPGKRQRGRHA